MFDGSVHPKIRGLNVHRSYHSWNCLGAAALTAQNPHVRCLQKGSVKSGPLAAALVEVYLGSKTVSPALERDFVSTVHAVMNGEK
jgi:hypothetical protein